MKFSRLNLICECGHQARFFHAVGFTADYELVVHWKCFKCGKLAYYVRSLADCCRQCPETESNSDLDDARFLQSLGIRP